MKCSRIFIGIGLVALGTACSGGVADDSPLRQAPKVREASGALPEPQLVCRPKFALFIGWTRQILQLNDNRTVVVSSPGEHGGSYLYFVNSDDLTVERFSIPKNHGSPSNAVVGPDGHLYLPPHTDGCVYKFDVNTHVP